MTRTARSTLRPKPRLAAAAVASLLLGGCADPLTALSAVSFGSTLMTFHATGKFPTDIAISEQRREDCSLVYLAEDLTYCRPLKEVPQPARLFCYRELGTVECYEVADPYRSRSRPVQDPPLAPTPASAPAVATEPATPAS